MGIDSSRRKILLTGVSRGLGKALGQRLIDADHRVAGCATNQTALDELSRRFPHGSFQAVDIVDASAVERWVKSNTSADEEILLINNAGLINRNANLWDVPTAEFQRVVDVNLAGTFHCIRAVVPIMLEAGRGGIINFSSTWGSSAAAEVAPYCATKWAVEGLTQALAEELPPPLFAAAVNPGVVHTDMLTSCFGEDASHYPSPEEWAEVAMPFLLSLDREQNGNVLRVPQ